MGRVRASRSDSSTPKALERTLEEEEEEEEASFLLENGRQPSKEICYCYCSFRLIIDVVVVDVRLCHNR